MARHQRLDVYTAILKTGLVPLYYSPDSLEVQQVVRACFAGGCPVFEFTNRGEAALDVFRDLVKMTTREIPDLMLGVGSIVDAPTAAIFIASGANFIVGPNLNPEVARLCNRRKIAYLPGCATATEIAQAEELGAEIVKIFPGETVGGPQFIKAIAGPCPWTRLMPTGGVEPTSESMDAWFNAGAAAVGMGSKLISREILKEKDYAGLTERVRKVLSMIKNRIG
jgi:2-dehydro-3-deoxyphosphogluconate aldolase / (4S)-4-hydroxy-2-oxoglutarate aldolase